MTEQLKGHGHVTPNADGFLARCGGPSICKVCKAELAALKAQEPVEYQLRALIRDVTNIPEAGYYMPQSWHDQVIALSLSGKLDAPVSEAKAQGVVMPERDAVIRKAVGMCNRIPGSTTWNAAEFAYDEFAARLSAAPAAPAADAGLVEALEKLARLGNGDKYGNSDGNLIAQAALAANRAKGVV